MYKCSITKRIVPAGTPAEKVVVEIRPVVYQIMWNKGEVEKMITQSKGWEIVREVLVSPKAASTMPTIEDLIEKAKGLEPTVRVQYLDKRPRWKRPSNFRRKYKGRLKVVKE